MSRFPSDDIFETLRHEIVGVRVPLPPKTPEEKLENQDKDPDVPDSVASGSTATSNMDIDGKVL